MAQGIGDEHRPHVGAARLFYEHLAQASPDLLGEVLCTFINQLLPAGVVQVFSAAYGIGKVRKTGLMAHDARTLA